ncbi:MAG: hypothetical protein H6559_10020 [Lewinellaceae bacterium]|nr:hypothetical protein [Lewinellaceae bacterium]
MKNAAMALFLLLILTSGCGKDNFERKFEDVLGTYYGTATKYRSYGKEIYDDEGNFLEVVTVEETEEYPDTIIVTGVPEEGIFQAWGHSFEWDGGYDYEMKEGFSGYYSNTLRVRFDPKEDVLELENSSWHYVAYGPNTSTSYAFYGEKH